MQHNKPTVYRTQQPSVTKQEVKVTVDNSETNNHLKDTNKSINHSVSKQQQMLNVLGEIRQAVSQDGKKETKPKNNIRVSELPKEVINLNRY